MKTILLAGETPLNPSEAGARVPNAMIEIGGRPIITRVMDIYRRFGHHDFIIAAGEGSMMLKQFFANYHMMANDLTVQIASGRIELQQGDDITWTVRIVDTGLRTPDFDRVGQLRKAVGSGAFMLGYADALGNVDIGALLDFHRSHGKLATVTAVRPPVRTGALQLRDNRVIAHTPDLASDDSWISGGFFVLEPEVFDYLLDDDSMIVERAPLMQLALDGELMAYRHGGFWHPLESARDRRFLDRFCHSLVPPWLRFEGPKMPDIMAAQ